MRGERGQAALELLAGLPALLALALVVEVLESEPAQLVPPPAIAIVPAAPKSGASTLARMLAAELAARSEGAAIVATTGGPGRRGAPPSRAAARLATALGTLPEA